MFKLYSVKFKQHEDAPVIKGHKVQEMILDEAKDDYSVAPEAPVRNFEQQLSDENSSALR